MYKRILVPLDGSRLSLKAIPHAAQIAKRFDAEVVLMKAEQPTSLASVAGVTMGGMVGTGVDPMAVEMASQEADRQNRDRIAAARQYLGRHLRKLKSQGVAASKREVLGQVSDSILGTCKKEKIDLIVMTTRGRSGLKRAVLGSITDEVVRRSGVPVLVVTL